MWSVTKKVQKIESFLVVHYSTQDASAGLCVGHGKSKVIYDHLYNRLCDYMVIYVI